MRAGRGIGGLAGAGAAFALALLPKCPLCALPLLAVAGIALPHGPAVEALVAAAVAAWLGIVLASARWLPVRLAAVAAAAAILVGRLASMPWLTFVGAALMLGIGIWMALRPRACHLPGKTLSPHRGERAG